jgi:chaperonin cofactor prefoldin
MAMDAVLKQLESRIEELVTAYKAAEKEKSSLAAKVEKLEAQLTSESDLGGRVSELEKQRDDLGKRLEKVLALIDGTLADAD